MKHSFLIDTDALYICILLFLMMIAILSLSYKFGEKSKAKSSNDAGILGSLVGLFALLLAFSFGMAGSRFEDRKNNIIEETNDIGTAILRSDIYPDSAKIAFRQDFEKYLNSRILYFKSKKGDPNIELSLRNADLAAKSLWKRASFYAKNKDYLIQSQVMLPALNSMFDIAASTNALFNSYVPETIIYLLLAFSLILSFYIGFNAGYKKHIDKIYLFGFCLLTSIVVYTILDLDRPRRGVITIQNEIILLEQLKNNF